MQTATHRQHRPCASRARHINPSRRSSEGLVLHAQARTTPQLYTCGARRWTRLPASRNSYPASRALPVLLVQSSKGREKPTRASRAVWTASVAVGALGFASRASGHTCLLSVRHDKRPISTISRCIRWPSAVLQNWTQHGLTRARVASGGLDKRSRQLCGEMVARKIQAPNFPRRTSARHQWFIAAQSCGSHSRRTGCFHVRMHRARRISKKIEALCNCALAAAPILLCRAARAFPVAGYQIRPNLRRKSRQRYNETSKPWSHTMTVPRSNHFACAYLIGHRSSGARGCTHTFPLMSVDGATFAPSICMAPAAVRDRPTSGIT